MNYTRVRKYIRSVATPVLVGAMMLMIAPAVSIISAQDRLTPDQIIARHLESIGSDEARRGTTSQIALGTCRATFRGRNSGVLDGRAVVASENNRNLIGIQFDSPAYPHEKVGFDGEQFRVGYIRPGVRSSLGSFFLIHDTIFKEGLVGGTLSSAWPLLNLSARGARLEYTGTERINNRQAHKLRYTPRRGSDLQITLYFDAENFRHVRTQYDRVVSSRIGGGVDGSARQRETRYKMVEDFSEFRTEGRLTLPHRYELELFIDTMNGTISHEYLFELSQFSFNQEIGAEFFNAEAS